MDKRKVLALGLGLTLALSGLFACDKKEEQEHVHEYQNYIAKEATCAEEGALERTCKTCGHKVVETIEKKAHTMVHGVCSVCGASQTPTPTPDEVSAAAFDTWESIYEQSKLLGYTMTKEEFFKNLNDTSFSSMYINKSGNLKVTVDGESYVNVGKVRKNVVFQGATDKEIYELEIEDCVLFATYYQGMRTAFGGIKGLASGGNLITGGLINLNNEVWIVYEDGTVQFIGKISSQPMEVDESTLIYVRGGSYGCWVEGAFSKNVKEVNVASTHLGLSIAGIDAYAFEGYTALEKVVIAEGVTMIEREAFADCTALTEVHLPKSIRYIRTAAFEGCTNLKKIYYAGTQAEWGELLIAASGLVGIEVICQG